MSYRPLNTDFSKMPDPVIESEAKIIVASVVSNPHFPTPEPSISDLNAAIAAYSAALANAASGDRAAIQVKKQKKLALANALNTLAIYVELQAKGDLAILASSNIKIKKPNAPQTLGPIESHSVSFGQPGELVSKVKIKYARSFLHECTEAPVTSESKWRQAVCTSSKCIFPGLESGKTYASRVTIIGAREQMVTTSIMTSIVI